MVLWLWPPSLITVSFPPTPPTHLTSATRWRTVLWETMKKMAPGENEHILIFSYFCSVHCKDSCGHFLKVRSWSLTTPGADLPLPPTYMETHDGSPTLFLMNLHSQSHCGASTSIAPWARIRILDSFLSPPKMVTGRRGFKATSQVERCSQHRQNNGRREMSNRCTWRWNWLSLVTTSWFWQNPYSGMNQNISSNIKKREPVAVWAGQSRAAKPKPTIISSTNITWALTSKLYVNITTSVAILWTLKQTRPHRWSSYSPNWHWWLGGLQGGGEQDQGQQDQQDQGAHLQGGGEAPTGEEEVESKIRQKRNWMGGDERREVVGSILPETKRCTHWSREITGARSDTCCVSRW